MKITLNAPNAITELRCKTLEIVDQDELQHLDELDKEWVEAWKKTL